MGSSANGGTARPFQSKLFLLYILIALSSLVLLLFFTWDHLPSFSNSSTSKYKLTSQRLGFSPSTDRLKQAIDDSVSDALDQKIGQVLVTKLNCKRPNYHRYVKLQGRRILLALNLHDSQDVLPTLLHALMDTIRFIGPEHVFLSIYESGSGDRSSPMIHTAVSFFKDLGLGGMEVATDAMTLDFDKMNRIKVLAEYRNLAIQPLYTMDPPPTEIFFINDIFCCAHQLLELLYQHVTYAADITSGFDWEDNGIFRDTWVARDITGSIITNMPDDEFAYSDDMFPNSPIDKAHYERGESFQMYSTWNGAIVINPVPFLRHHVRFRRSRRNECAASEAVLLSKDFWSFNYTHILAVPTVNVAYTLDAARAQLEKTNSRHLFNGEVEWAKSPPEKVACRPWPEENGLNHGPLWQKTKWVDSVDDDETLSTMDTWEEGLEADGNWRDPPSSPPREAEQPSEERRQEESHERLRRSRHWGRSRTDQS